MAWYAYCITEQKAFLGSVRSRRPFPVEGLNGVNRSQVFAYPSGELAVIVSEYTLGELNQQAVIDHARVVSECFRNTTVLPFRFGTIFDHDDALRRAIRANRKAFTDSVYRLKGKAEMHLKLVVKDGSLREAMNDIELPASVGGEYLTRLREKAARHRERQTKARALSVQVNKLFHPLEEEVSCRKNETGAMLIDIAHLIDEKSIERYQNSLNSAARQLKNCEILLSGPWPPYHFTPGKLRTPGSTNS
ncbi:MAG TPA: GvpL/GvpF family gas vesicle protein [Terriglobales bacterium]|nr:GvpL/GvpF family gas vesicle protein [Terriglobales bacterium]